jgi:hypothetical protein
MRVNSRTWIIVGLLAGCAAPAHAQEIFGGVLAHDVDTFLTKGGFEDGADLQLGWRGERIRSLRFIGSPSPYVFGSVATGGETHFAAAGLSWRLGGRLYVRPGIGIAIHNRDDDGVINNIRTDLGSRILFEPEVGIGYQVSPKLSVHLSHAQLLSRQNPGMDSIGVRLNYRLR